MEEITKFSLVCKDLMEKEVEEMLKSCPNFVITNYLGLSSGSLNDLRKEARKVGSKYFVLKNRLCKRVFSRLKLDELLDAIDGGCGIAFITGDVIQSAKFLAGFSKKNESFVIKSARIDGKRLDSERVKELASLPSREVLLTMIVSAMQAPINGFVGVLSGVLRNFVYALNAIKDKKGVEDPSRPSAN